MKGPCFWKAYFNWFMGKITWNKSGRHHSVHYVHFADEDTEAQRRELDDMSGGWVARPGPDLGLPLAVLFSSLLHLLDFLNQLASPLGISSCLLLFHPRGSDLFSPKTEISLFCIESSSHYLWLSFFLPHKEPVHKWNLDKRLAVWTTKSKNHELKLLTKLSPNFQRCQ